MIEEHNEVEDLIYAQEDKLNAIGFIIDSLRDLAEKSKDSNVSSLFTKAPNIRLEESRLIKLKRFTDK
jgi:Na+/serine symporter